MLTIKNLSFNYQNQNFSLLENISFQLKEGSNLAVIGESGCGKSTLLKLIYGLYDLNEGSIFWNEEEVLGPKFHLVPGMPYMKYLAQDFDLMPFITVAENVGKYLSNFYPEEKKRRIAELLDVVEMTEYANIKAKYLSGGQMQRVALAKVLALEPEVLLLDEPFSHIDNFRKNSLRRQIFKYLKDKNITCIVATHDVNDVFSFSDEVLVMKEGKVVAHDITKNVYENPSSFYVASLFGEVNMVTINKVPHFIFPHEVEVSDVFDFEVKVKASFFKGSHYLIIGEINDKPFFFEHRASIPTGEIVGVKIKKGL